MFWEGWISLHVFPVTDVCRSVTCKLCSPGIFFRFPPVPNAEDDWWFCFRSPLWPVIIPASHCVILSTIYHQEDVAFPAFLCGLRVSMVWTRRSCMGIRVRSRLAPALAQVTFTAKMFICLHCDHTCLQKSLSLPPGVVVLHRLLMPTWSTSHRSLDFVRIVKLTTSTPPAVSSTPVPRQQNRCLCVYGIVARSSCQTGKDCFLAWVDGVKSGWASGIEPATLRSVYLYHL